MLDLPVALIRLAVGRVAELGSTVYTIHQGLERWQPDDKKLSSIDRTKESLKIQYAVEEQKKWCDAILRLLSEKTNDRPRPDSSSYGPSRPPAAPAGNADV